jgi:hypothetical protein
MSVISKAAVFRSIKCPIDIHEITYNSLYFRNLIYVETFHILFQGMSLRAGISITYFHTYLNLISS